MNEKNLVICDGEIQYANSLCENILVRNELNLKVYTCTSAKNAMQFLSGKQINILIIDEKYPYEERIAAEAEQTFVLTKEACGDLGEEEKQIYKYQCADKILNEIFVSYYEKTNQNLLRVIKKEKQKLVAVYSPIRRTGKTAFALELGKQLAKSEKTLYLNLEEYADIGGRFLRADGKNLGDLLYYMRQDNGNLGLRLAIMIEKMGELDYIPPILTGEDLKEVTLEEWRKLLEYILQESMYENVILDLGEGIQGLFSVLGMCDRIYMPVSEDDISVQKLHCYEESLAYRHMEALEQRTYRFVVPEDLNTYVRQLIKEKK